MLLTFCSLFLLTAGVGGWGLGGRLLPPVFLLSAPSSAKFGKLRFTFLPLLPTADSPSLS